MSRLRARIIRLESRAAAKPRSAHGKPWASFPVAVDAKTDGEVPATWVRVALFGATVSALAPRLTKGAEVYCEGRLSLGTWTGRDGEARAGLNLAAWEVQPMGQIGRRKPKVRPRDEQGAVPFDAAGAAP